MNKYHVLIESYGEMFIVQLPEDQGELKEMVGNKVRTPVSITILGELPPIVDIKKFKQEVRSEYAEELLRKGFGIK
jgi:hypothetical protein